MKIHISDQTSLRICNSVCVQSTVFFSTTCLCKVKIIPAFFIFLFLRGCLLYIYIFPIIKSRENELNQGPVV